MIRTLLVANRAEIAHRIFRTCRALGLSTVAVFSDADSALPFVAAADRAVRIGPGPAAESYLDPARVLAAAERSGADAIHPGYGFLSENADFAEAVVRAGLVWVGPPPAAIRAMGDKAAARRVAEDLGIPVVPGFDGSQDDDALAAAAAQLGFPVLIKAVAGGGGRGMRQVGDADEFEAALASARREARGAFGSDDVILERVVSQPRHVEVQVLADQHGAVLHLGERDCSVQRRHQKVIEEAPSGAVDPALRATLGEAACRVARAVGYVGAGTVEFLVDDVGAFFFLEMNTRLQVEHPVTEQVTGLDLVALQLLVADGEPLGLTQDEVRIDGWAIEARVVAEDSLRDYLPAAGSLVRVDLPGSEGIRVDAGFATGDEVSPHYDGLLAKIIATGPDRKTATRRLLRAVEQAWVPGIPTNLPLLRQALGHDHWASGRVTTAFLADAGLPVAPLTNLARGALAATCLGVAQRRSHTDAVPAGFRLGGPAEQADTWRCGAEEVVVRWTPTADGLRAVVGEMEHNVALGALDGDVLQVEVDGVRQSWRLAWVRARPGHTSVDDGDTVYAHLGDGEAFVQLVPRFPAQADAVVPGTCTAATPGKVVWVSVAVGDAVKAGQLLVVLEAMKMEHRVTAPQDGMVAEVRIAPGDQVGQGDLLVRVADAP